MVNIVISSVSKEAYDKLKDLSDRKGIKPSTLCKMWVHERMEQEI